MPALLITFDKRGNLLGHAMIDDADDAGTQPGDPDLAPTPATPAASA
jgi:hypothetical protein